MIPEDAEIIHTTEIDANEAAQIDALSKHMIGFTGMKSLLMAIAEKRIDHFSSMIAARVLARFIQKSVFGNEVDHPLTVIAEDAMRAYVEKRKDEFKVGSFSDLTEKIKSDKIDDDPDLSHILTIVATLEKLIALDAEKKPKTHTEH